MPAPRCCIRPVSRVHTSTRPEQQSTPRPKASASSPEAGLVRRGAEPGRSRPELARRPLFVRKHFCFCTCISEVRRPLRRAKWWSRGYRDKVRQVVRVVQIFRNFDDAAEADHQFYADLTPEERLDILLELVERHRSTLGEAAGRFERVHRIVELSQR